jgi:hypothetical protein
MAYGSLEEDGRPQQRHGELRIRYDEVVADAKESREKLVALIERARKDQEEAQKVKIERDELSRALERF